MSVFELTTTFYQITCGECGTTFAITGGYDNRRRKDHKDFHCPNGHSLAYNRDNKEEQLSKMLGRANSRNSHLSDQLEATKRSRDSHKGHVTRIRNRISIQITRCS